MVSVLHPGRLFLGCHRYLSSSLCSSSRLWPSWSIWVPHRILVEVVTWLSPVKSSHVSRRASKFCEGTLSTFSAVQQTLKGKKSNNLNLTIFFKTGFPHGEKERPNEVFPKCFTEFSHKNICHYSRRTQTGHPATSCARDQNARKTHLRDRIFKLSPIHASVIYQFPWIRLIHWIQWKFCSI